MGEQKIPCYRTHPESRLCLRQQPQSFRPSNLDLLLHLLRPRQPLLDAPPISPPPTATSTATSSTQFLSEILNLQRHFRLVEEGWKHESMLLSSDAGPIAESDADLSSRSLDFLDAQVDLLQKTKKSPTFPASPFLPPPDSQESLSSLSPLPSPHIQVDAELEKEDSPASPPAVASQKKTFSISTPGTLALTIFLLYRHPIQGS
ncbi:hypothetical protein BKA70DRAFT_247940 [Coprinopsis sp. MPI-PUGE-AT-0042]|nr:hypothetical protein BKA70DRAFT_288057 [Coprinopsis sp. MPI-PUGE-AT-0042]KAH6876305.1 hypothetical protein BKA70DRAFT_247879 [Coprinopsis sp. MPI-PUGE-AT-0042]KAH6876316.1 hypothetical protein BKA70DRAFT_247940 [Coprinopsis sp. MPI-PUGE-AT-0042]